MTTPVILSVEEVADRINRTPSMVQKLFNGSNPMESFRVGKQICTFEDKVEEYLKNNTKSFSQLKQMLKEQAEKSYTQTTLSNLAYIQKDLLAFQTSFHMHNVEKAITFVDLAIAEIEEVLAVQS
jgi:hypothetical protein